MAAFTPPSDNSPVVPSQPDLGLKIPEIAIRYKAPERRRPSNFGNILPGTMLMDRPDKNSAETARTYTGRRIRVKYLSAWERNPEDGILYRKAVMIGEPSPRGSRLMRTSQHQAISDFYRENQVFFEARRGGDRSFWIGVRPGRKGEKGHMITSDFG